MVLILLECIIIIIVIIIFVVTFMQCIYKLYTWKKPSL